MRVVIVLPSIFALVLSYADISEKEHFEEIIKDPETLRQQLYCYLDRGSCSEVAAKHKVHITEAVNTACAKCTPTHKHNVHVFIRACQTLFPKLFFEFRHRYDPDGKHYDMMKEEVQKY